MPLGLGTSGLFEPGALFSGEVTHFPIGWWDSALVVDGPNSVWGHPGLPGGFGHGFCDPRTA